MDGLLRCSRYAFGPNRLHYCGPDANRELLSYIEQEEADFGLTAMLQKFQTMYPYLRLIAESNHIRNVFDDRVVEAYWLGNDLLDHVGHRVFYTHLRDDHHLGKRLGMNAMDILGQKVVQGAVPHHSFHVIDIWRQTGLQDRDVTLENMDSCRISWGTVTKVDGPNITVVTEPLIIRDGKLALGEVITSKVTRSLGAEADIESLKIGDIITIHWGVPCEVVTKKQAAELRRRTLSHIALANQTL